MVVANDINSDGLNIAQDSMDNPQTLAKKVLEKEHILYPQVIRWYTQGRLKLLNNKSVILDRQPI